LKKGLQQIHVLWFTIITQTANYATGSPTTTMSFFCRSGTGADFVFRIDFPVALFPINGCTEGAEQLLVLHEFISLIILRFFHFYKRLKKAILGTAKSLREANPSSHYSTNLRQSISTEFLKLFRHS
jgi:hypothetical protein